MKACFVTVDNLFVTGLQGGYRSLPTSFCWFSSCTVDMIPTTSTKYRQVSAPSLQIENTSRAEAGTAVRQVTVKVLAKQLCIFTSAWVGTLISMQALASLTFMADGRFKNM